MIPVPEQFAAGLTEREGEAGSAWIRELPSIVAGLCRQWTLLVDGPPMHGHLGLVVPVRRGEEPCALKVSWIDESTVHEIEALNTWDGRGTVRLLEAAPDAGAMLLERLDAGRSLNDIPIDRAVVIAGELIRLLSIDGNARLPAMSEVAQAIGRSLYDRWERVGRPMPRRLVDLAADHVLQLSPAPDRRMVNWDLHYLNVHAGTRLPWLVIDPKVVIGSPEFGIAQLLWTRLDDVEGPADLRRLVRVLIETAGLDAALARAWTLVRVIDYWLWALSVGFTVDPTRCETVIDWIGY